MRSSVRPARIRPRRPVRRSRRASGTPKRPKTATMARAEFSTHATIAARGTGGAVGPTLTTTSPPWTTTRNVSPRTIWRRRERMPPGSSPGSNRPRRCDAQPTMCQDSPQNQMMQHKPLRLAVVLAVSGLVASCSGGNPFPPVTIDFGQLASDAPRAVSLPLDEKVGQLFVVPARGVYMSSDSKDFQTLRHHVVDNRVGGIVLFTLERVRSRRPRRKAPGAREGSASRLGRSRGRPRDAFRRRDVRPVGDGDRRGG